MCVWQRSTTCVPSPRVVQHMHERDEVSLVGTVPEVVEDSSLPRPLLLLHGRLHLRFENSLLVPNADFSKLPPTLGQFSQGKRSRARDATAVSLGDDPRSPVRGISSRLPLGNISTTARGIFGRWPRRIILLARRRAEYGRQGILGRRRATASEMRPKGASLSKRRPY